MASVDHGTDQNLTQYDKPVSMKCTSYTGTDDCSASVTEVWLQSRNDVWILMVLNLSTMTNYHTSFLCFCLASEVLSFQTAKLKAEILLKYNTYQKSARNWRCYTHEKTLSGEPFISTYLKPKCMWKKLKICRCKLFHLKNNEMDSLKQTEA